MRRLFLGATLVVLTLVGLTLTNGTTAGRVETTKRATAGPSARPAQADQVWAANPTEADSSPDEVSYEIAVSSDEPDASIRSYEAETAANDYRTSVASEVVDADPETEAALAPDPDEDLNDADSAADPEEGEEGQSASDETDTADAVSPESGDSAGEEELAIDASSFATSQDDEADTENADVEADEGASATATTASTTTTTTTTAPPATTTTTTRPVTTTTKRPSTTQVDDPTAALANAIHSDRATTSTARARVESKTQPFLTAYGPDGLPQLQPLPTDPYAPTPDIRMGTIRIPAIGLDHSLHQGMTLTALDRGPSQWPGSAEPGQVGNMVIGGHRTTRTRPFRNLDDLNKGDEVIVTDNDGVDWTYEVVVVEIVTPDAVHIASQTAEPTATLFACHPPGSARQRIVVKLALA